MVVSPVVSAHYCWHSRHNQHPAAIMKHRAALACVLAPAAALSVGAAAAQDVCALRPAGTVTVAAVRDGRTLALTDGRELRLAAIEADAASRAALSSLAEGQTLILKTPAEAGDRYGRVVAFAFPPGAARSLQISLLEQGRARVSARPGGKACAAPLLAAEGAARAAKAGFWADPNFAPLRAENRAGLSAKRGDFALVEGKVLSVRESGATIYANFGRRWTRDFTVTILKRMQRTFAAAGLDPKGLEGRRVRVRGYIELRGGPVIAAEAPEQIELID
jgi:endonuclease YncB( thermonuclease family)